MMLYSLLQYDFLGKKIAVLQPRKPNTITFGALFILGTVMNRAMLIHRHPVAAAGFMAGS
jgi:hypothetical protein